MPAPSDSCQGPGQTRPGTVSTTGYLLFGVALSSVLSLIAALSSYPAVKSVYETVFGGTAHGIVAPEDLAVFAVGVSAAIVLTYGATALILVPFVFKGRQQARILTWVLCGLLLCCQGSSVAGVGISASSLGEANSDYFRVDAAEVTRQLRDSLPSWVHPVELGAGGLAVVLASVIIVLLALPSSNSFFRRQ
ncbi:hypothetical protein AB0B31_14740 [Catellatospora citrea]|uniref:hypothetical protein n=1 Tax=Catellatospora citrea TaxID=53366 RepID=UPI0034032EF1